MGSPRIPARVRRTVLFTGGPDGDQKVSAYHGSLPAPSHICQRKPGDVWRHYVHVTDQRYEHRGPCIEFHEGEEQPGDWACCCGEKDCGC